MPFVPPKFPAGTYSRSLRKNHFRMIQDRFYHDGEWICPDHYKPGILHIARYDFGEKECHRCGELNTNTLQKIPSLEIYSCCKTCVKKEAEELGYEFCVKCYELNGEARKCRYTAPEVKNLGTYVRK